MNHGQFTEGKIDWYRSPIDPQLLRELMQRNNWRACLQTFGHLGWFFTTGLCAYFAFTLVDASNWYWSIPLLLLTLFAHGTMGPFMGLIAIHELQHKTVFRSRQVNAFFERLYAFISWSDYLWYKQSHARHHQSTCHAKHDGEVVLPLRFSLRNWRTWLALLAWNPNTTWQRLVLTWRHANGDIRGDWYNYVIPEADLVLRVQHKRWARLLLFGHATLATLFVASGHWFLVVVFTFGTQYCAWLGFLCGVTQHYGLASDVPDFRYSTRTFTCSWLPAFYYWNMQYHLEHHMFPAVPFYNLPKLRGAIAQDLPPAPHGLWATWQEMLTLRDRFRIDPHYVHKPDVP